MITESERKILAEVEDVAKYPSLYHQDEINEIVGKGMVVLTAWKRRISELERAK